MFYSTGQGFNGNNMFAYCGNNPVFRMDQSGFFWNFLIAGAVSAIVNVATTYIAAKATGQDYTWRDALVAAAAGAVNVVPYAGPILSGTITGVYTGVMAYQNGASVGAAFGAGAFAGVCTTASIGNLANAANVGLNTVGNAAVDLVFGTGYNSMAAATYKAVTTNPVKGATQVFEEIQPAQKTASNQTKFNRAACALDRKLLC